MTKQCFSDAEYEAAVAALAAMPHKSRMSLGAVVELLAGDAIAIGLLFANANEQAELDAHNRVSLADIPSPSNSRN